MSMDLEPIAEQSRTVRSVLTVTQVYFYASLAAGVALMVIYWLDWQPIAEYAMPSLLFLMFAAFAVYPIALFLTFRSPNWCVELLRFRMMTNILILLLMSTAMAGMPYLALFYLPAIVFFGAQYRKSLRREIATG